MNQIERKECDEAEQHSADQILQNARRCPAVITSLGFGQQGKKKMGCKSNRGKSGQLIPVPAKASTKGGMSDGADQISPLLSKGTRPRLNGKEQDS